MLWSPGDVGWSAFSYAAMLSFVNSKDGQLAPDVLLTQVEARGRSVRLRAMDNADEVRAIMRQMTQVASEASVRRLSFSVYKDGLEICLEADEHGLFRVVPARSVGGLPHERIKRRLDDIRYASTRISSVMSDVIRQIEDDEPRPSSPGTERASGATA